MSLVGCDYVNLLKVQKFVGIKASTSEKFNILICKFIQNEKTQILLKIDNITLEEKVEQLEQWDQQKDQILFNITHDLKTPLNAIIQMMEEAKQTDNEKERNDNLSLALCNSELLFNLINDILDFAQLKQQTLKIIVQKVNLLEVVESVLQIMRIQTEMKGIELKFINKIDPNNSTISTDQRRLKQILINLIGNAIKFTTKGSIQITLDTIQSFYKFEILDTGTGIKPKIISKLCQPFQTFGNEKFKNSSGVGLGLCFCKELVGLLGPFQGLFIDSVYGKGAKFGFLIENKQNINSSQKKNKAMKASIVSQNQIENLQQEFGNIHEYFSEFPCRIEPEMEEFMQTNDQPEVQITSYLRNTKELSKKFNFEKKKSEQQNQHPTQNILIVDDSPFNLIVLKQQLNKLQNYNFDIFQGYNGEMAVEQFKLFNSQKSIKNIKLIFMDCNMPIMDGYQASDEIKRLIEFENYIPVQIVALSAQILETNQISFDYILNKPCSLQQLEKCLQKIKIN